MYDYNFFGDVKVKSNAKGKGTGLSLGIFFGSLLLIGGVVGFFYFQAGQIRADIEDLNTQLNASAGLEVLKRVEEKQVTLQQMQAMGEGLRVGRETFDAGEKIQQSMVDQITNALPSDAQVLSISANNDLISLSGVAAARSAIAEFQRSIRLSGIGSEVRVGSISHDETLDEYSFSMTIELGGEPDESVN